MKLDPEYFKLVEINDFQRAGLDFVRHGIALSTILPLLEFNISSSSSSSSWQEKTITQGQIVTFSEKDTEKNIKALERLGLRVTSATSLSKFQAERRLGISRELVLFDFILVYC